jgi:raffinose/stachyose/melibiose transport system substrate-binding protein
VNKRKKHFGLLLVVCMALSIVLAGCGTKSNSSNSSAPVTISIFQSKVEISKQLEQLAKTYTKQTGVKVDVWGTTGDSYAQQLQTKLASNQGPTIMSIPPGSLPGSEADKLKSYLYDMSNQSYVKDIAPNMALKIGGKVVGVPYDVEGFGLVYNKSLINPKNVTDYNSFVNTLKQMKAKGINGLGLSQEAYFLIGHIINTPFALQPNPQQFIQQLNAGKVSMAGNKTFQDFANYMVAIREYTKNPLKVTYDQEIGDFANGKDAMIHQGNWAYSMFKTYKVNFQMGMMPFPLDGNNKLAVGVSNNWSINKNASPAQIKAANDFLNWLFTSKTGQDYIVNKFGFIPAMTNIKAGKLDPLSQQVLDASRSGQTIPWAMNDFPNNMIVNNLVQVAQQFFLTPSMTGPEFLKALDQAWQNGAGQ